MMSKTKKMTTITMLIAISILFHMIESMIPIPVPIPGFKLGLANIVGLIALYLFDEKVMLEVNLCVFYWHLYCEVCYLGQVFGCPCVERY